MLGVAALLAVRTARHESSCSRLRLHSSTLQLLGAAVSGEGYRPYSIKLTSQLHPAVGWQGQCGLVCSALCLAMGGAAAGTPKRSQLWCLCGL